MAEIKFNLSNRNTEKLYEALIFFSGKPIRLEGHQFNSVDFRLDEQADGQSNNNFRKKSLKQLCLNLISTHEYAKEFEEMIRLQNAIKHPAFTETVDNSDVEINNRIESRDRIE